MTKKILTLLYGCFISVCIVAQAPTFELAKQIGGSGSDSGHSIATDFLGNIYVTGEFRDTVDFDSGPGEHLLISNGNADIFVVKYQPDGALVWAYSFGDSSPNDRGYGITVDLAGNIYVTGFFRGTVDFDPSSNDNILSTGPSSDMFVLKLSNDGTFIWAKDIGESGSVFGRAIATDSIGNLYATGDFGGTVDFDPNSSVFNLTANDGKDIFILKLSYEGNFLWANSIGSNEFDEDSRGTSLALDNDGNLYTTGYFEGTADFDTGAGEFELTSSGFKDQFILKINNVGDFVWVKQMSGSNSVQGLGLTVNKNNEIITTGSFGGTVDFDPGTNQFNISGFGLSDIFISKLNSEGNFIWTESIGSLGHERGNAIVLDDSSNIYITGSFQKSVDFNPGIDTFILSNLEGEGNDIFILKLDENGSFIWAGSFVGEGGSPFTTTLETGYSIAVDKWNNIYSTGNFQFSNDFDPGPDNFELSSNEEPDVFIHKMSQQFCSGQVVIDSGNNDFTICKGQSVSLFANLSPEIADSSYTWSTGENTDSIVVTPDTTTTYIVNVNYAPTCTSVDTVTIFVHPASDTTYISLTSCDSTDVGFMAFIFSDINGCDSTVIETTTFIQLPQTPTSPDDIVIQQDEPPFQISVPEIIGAIGYEWTVPTGVQILSGVNTNTITIDWGTVATSGVICVSAINECGNSEPNCMEVTVELIDPLNEINKIAYSIFPNPTDKDFYVVLKDEQIYEIVLYDLLGKEVHVLEKKSGKVKVKVEGLISGTYWLKIKCLDCERIKIQAWERLLIL